RWKPAPACPRPPLSPTPRLPRGTSPPGSRRAGAGTGWTRASVGLAWLWLAPTIVVRTMLPAPRNNRETTGNNKADGPEAIRFGNFLKLVDGVVGVARPPGLLTVAGGLLMTREAGEPLGARGVRGVREYVAHGL